MPQTFVVTRRAPSRHPDNRNALLRIEVSDAMSGAEAGFVADEVVYAAGHVLGVYPDDQHQAQPEDWALTDARAALREQGWTPRY